MSRTVQLPLRKQLLKSATRQLVSDFGGQVAAGKHLGKRHQRYSDVGLRNTSVFMTIDEAAELEDNVDDPVVTRAMARRQGFSLIRMSDEPPEGTDWLTHVSELSAEAGDLTSDITKSVANGDGVTPAEIDFHDMEASAARLMDIAAGMFNTIQLDKEG